MVKRDRILLDANALIAITYHLDPHHTRAVEELKQVKEQRALLITNNHVIDEVLTVTSIRAKSLKQAVELGESVYGAEPQWFRVYRTPLAWEKEAFELFKSQQVYKKDQFLSFTDCVLLIQARRQKIKTIFSFDEVFKRFERDGMRILS